MSDAWPDLPLAPIVELTLLTMLLHKLVDVGLGEVALADRVRDAMEGPWRALSPEEITRVDEFGARLNSARDLETAAMAGRTEELAMIMEHLAKAYWKEKGTAGPVCERCGGGVQGSYCRACADGT